MGALAVTPTTMWSPLEAELVSVSSDGDLANSDSYTAAISDDGRFVAFESDANNLAEEPDYNGGRSDIYYRDRVSNETTMVSYIDEDAVDYNRGSRSPTISDDGRYVAFVSGKNFVEGDTNGGGGAGSESGIDVYVRDMQTGEFHMCDLAGDGSAVGDGEVSAMISGNGKYVVVGTHLGIAPEDENGYRDVYRYEIESGETTLVSPIDTLDYDNYGAKPIGISDDGRYVAFITRRMIDESDLNGSGYDYYRKDLQTGEIDFVALNGGTDSADATYPESGEVMLSGNGRYLSFEIDASLLPEDENSGDGEKDVYRYDFDEEEFLLVTPVFEDMESGYRGSRSGAMNDDGSRIAFFTGRDYVSWDDNFSQDLYWYDMAADEYSWMELPVYAGGMNPKDIGPNVSFEINDDLDSLFMTGDGTMVVFHSQAALVERDTNGQEDVWVRKLAVDLVDGDYRLAGDDRYDTSVQISQEAFPDGADTVIIATGSNWPDALCGSALSGAADAPILLAAPGGLTASAKAEIIRLGATDAYVLGSETVVSLAIEHELDMMLSGYVDRIAGPDRYWTAKAITNKVIQLRPDRYDGTALVTTGGNYADAMAAAPLAAALAWPILLTNPLDDSTYTPADLSYAIILGGTPAVPQVVEDDLVDLIGAENVDRLGGANRYETAAMIAEYGVDAGMHWDGVGVASGVNFPDALAGGASLGRLGAVVLLTPPTVLAPAAKARLESNSADIDTVYILGGPAAVSPTVKAAVLAAVGF